ncbi:MAG: hypothetical protein NTZ26_04565 [Candidatus Aminicenantes bacterium]|nr:hypothetical protein [Candidatus Aminicenantes bacterium]
MTQPKLEPGPAVWTAAEGSQLARLNAPLRIQDWLNGIAYDPEPGTASPRRVLRERKANCFEGAMFAAAALRFHGHRPLLVDMRSHNDDDHVLAVFRENGAWGCVAKSNYTVLRFREPVYRTIRELMASYFDVFFNPIGEKTLREYSNPFDLSRFDDRDWMTTEEDISWIGDALDKARHVPFLTPAQLRDLRPSDPALVKAGLLGANPKGLFKPKP